MPAFENQITTSSNCKLGECVRWGGVISAGGMDSERQGEAVGEGKILCACKIDRLTQDQLAPGSQMVGMTRK